MRLWSFQALASETPVALQRWQANELTPFNWAELTAPQQKRLLDVLTADFQVEAGAMLSALFLAGDSGEVSKRLAAKRIEGPDMQAWQASLAAITDPRERAFAIADFQGRPDDFQTMSARISLKHLPPMSLAEVKAWFSKWRDGDVAGVARALLDWAALSGPAAQHVVRAFFDEAVASGD